MTLTLLTKFQLFILFLTFFQYIKLRAWCFRRLAERRFDAWQEEKLRGFENNEEESKIKEWRGKKDLEKGARNSPRPSTSTGFSRTRPHDPLARARDEWNKGITDEYRAKFEKWSTLKRQAEKSGTSKGNYYCTYLLNNFELLFISFLLLTKVIFKMKYLLLITF